MEENDVKSILRQRVAILRGNMSLKEFSEKSGINWKTLVNIEKEVHYPSMQVLLQFKKAFGVDVGWLIGETNRYRGFSSDNVQTLGLHPVCIDNLECMARHEGVIGVHTPKNPIYSRDEFDPEHYKLKINTVVHIALAAIRKHCPEEYKEIYSRMGKSVGCTSFYAEGEFDLEKGSEFELRIANTLLYNWTFISSLGAYFRSVDTDGIQLIDPPYSVTDKCTLDKVVRQLKSMRQSAIGILPELQRKYTPTEIERIMEKYYSLKDVIEQEED